VNLVKTQEVHTTIVVVIIPVSVVVVGEHTGRRLVVLCQSMQVLP
jgi:hypothetical protein